MAEFLRSGVPQAHAPRPPQHMKAAGERGKGTVTSVHRPYQRRYEEGLGAPGGPAHRAIQYGSKGGYPPRPPGAPKY